MSLLDKLENLEPQINRSKCGICTVLDALDDKEREAILKVLVEPADSLTRVTDRQLADVLASEGYRVTSTMVYRHRKNHLG